METPQIPTCVPGCPSLPSAARQSLPDKRWSRHFQAWAVRALLGQRCERLRDKAPRAAHAAQWPLQKADPGDRHLRLDGQALLQPRKHPVCGVVPAAPDQGARQQQNRLRRRVPIAHLDRVAQGVNGHRLPGVECAGHANRLLGVSAQRIAAQRQPVGAIHCRKRAGVAGLQGASDLELAAETDGGPDAPGEQY
jgi:hypothetical protein